MARRKDRPAGPLDSRSQAILRAVIEEYVSTAQPVGSQALVDRFHMGVSSATVRNVMADLENAGYLTHPHTSAGRVPTDAGYRYFVLQDAVFAPDLIAKTNVLTATVNPASNQLAVSAFTIGLRALIP